MSKVHVRAWFVFLGALAFGCSDDGSGSEAADSGNPVCVGGEFCPQGLECVNGYCVDPSAETGGPGDGDGDSTTTGDGDGDSTTTGDGDGDATTTGDGDGDATTTGDGDGEPGDGSCDPWGPNCPAGQKCVPYANGGSDWNDHKCVAITGTHTVGNSCTYDGPVAATDTCVDNLMCWTGTTAAGSGECVELCGGSINAPTCSGGKLCQLSYDDNVMLCLTDCDPLSQNCPSPSDACYSGQGDSFECYNAGDNPTGSVCMYYNDCAPGHVCIAPTALPNCMAGANQGCCGEWCDTSDPVCTLAGTACEPWYVPGQAPPGFENLGVCVAP